MIDQAKRDAIVSESAKWFCHDSSKIKDDIFCGTEPTYGGGIALFSYMKFDTLQKLVDSGFAKLDDAQNDAPTLGEFIDFLKDHSAFLVNGYVVEAERDDCRVTITGLEFLGAATNQQIEAFTYFSEGASEIEITPERLYCWWD
jgi:hypothetical protein